MAAFDEWDKVISPSEKEDENVVTEDDVVDVPELEQDKDDEVESLIELQEIAEEGVSISELEAFENAIQLSETLDDLVEESLNVDEFLEELENDDAEPLPLLEEWVEASAQEFDASHQEIALEIADNPESFFEEEPEITETIVRVTDSNGNELVTFANEDSSTEESIEEAGEDFLADLDESEVELEEIPLEESPQEQIEEKEEELLVSESEPIDLDAFVEEPLEESLEDEGFLADLEESEAESEEIPLEELPEEVEEKEELFVPESEPIDLDTFAEEPLEESLDDESFLADLDESEAETEEITLEVLSEKQVEEKEELFVPESEPIDLDTFAEEPLEESLEDESFLADLEESEAEIEEFPLEGLPEEQVEEKEEELLVANPEIALETLPDERVSEKSADFIELEQEQNEVSIKPVKIEDELDSENEIVPPMMTSSLEYDFSTVSVENENLVGANSSSKVDSSDKPEKTQGQRKTYYAAGISIVLLGVGYSGYNALKTTKGHSTKLNTITNNKPQKVINEQLATKKIELQPLVVKKTEKAVEQPIETIVEKELEQITSVTENEKELLQQQLAVAKKVEQALVKQLEEEAGKELEPLEIITKTEAERIPTESGSIKKAEELSVNANLSQEQKKHEAVAASGKQYRKEYFRIRMMMPQAQEGVEQNQAQSFEKCTTINYTIKKEDTLFEIAEHFTGNGFNYKKIARNNKIKNPSQLYWGTTIKIKNVKNVWCVKKDQA